MSKKHILVLSVSAGAGHVRAAQALCAAAERGFRQLRLTHVDVMDLVPAGFRKLYADSYIKLVEKMPLAWAYLYQYTDQRSAKSLFDRLRRNIERLNTRKFNRELKRWPRMRLSVLIFCPPNCCRAALRGADRRRQF